MNRKLILFYILGGFFITNALVAELIAGKIFAMPIPGFIQALLQLIGIGEKNFIVSVGVIPWPIVFVATDLVNEFFGRKGVRFYTYVTAGLITYTFLLLLLAEKVPAVDFSPVSQAAFTTVFRTSQWIIVGSLTAFLISQFIDILVFTHVRKRTGNKHLWARTTGSTLVSQLVDTFVVGFIGFYLPGSFTWNQYLQVGTTSYTYKILVAIAVTPLCYLGHMAIEKFLGKEEAKKMAHDAAQQGPTPLETFI
ncbi:MAG: queuosine precursor transporter [Deltaproteobacteria bacterium]|nr:queuosine precursor transporter [Deltaproteobacteria bacterium]